MSAVFIEVERFLAGMNPLARGALGPAMTCRRAGQRRHHRCTPPPQADAPWTQVSRHCGLGCDAAPGAWRQPDTQNSPSGSSCNANQAMGGVTMPTMERIRLDDGVV